MSLTEKACEIGGEAVAAARESGARRGRAVNVDQYAIGWLSSRCARLERELAASRAYARGLAKEVSA